MAPTHPAAARNLRGTTVPALARLSSEATCNLLAAENDEASHGLDDMLPLADLLPIVLDLHHHRCFTQGQHIAPDDPCIAPVAASRRGTRPLGHFLALREDLLPRGLDPDRLPDLAGLRVAGVPARELRRRSDRMWSRVIHDCALGHLRWANLEVEVKAKNLAGHESAEAVRAAAAARPGPPAPRRVASGAPSL